MKKTLIAILLTLTALLSLPALAQTTAVDAGGKTYVIGGENGVYEIDGITFVIEDGQVTVKAPGEAERVSPLAQSRGSVAAEGAEAGFSSPAVESATEDAFASGETGGANSAAPGSAASEGEPWTAEEMAAFCAPYAPFGLAWDASRGALTCQGKTVRSFLDVKTSNGESFSSGKFAGTVTNLYNDAGEIDVETIRDYAQPDETGAGKLLGLRVTDAD